MYYHLDVEIKINKISQKLEKKTNYFVTLHNNAFI